MDYKLINPSYLDSVAGEDPQIIEEIVTMFKEQATEMYLEMKSLHSGKDFKMLGMMAHKAKSSVAILGMSELADMLKVFELSAKEGKETELYDFYIEKFGEDTRSAITELDDLVSNRLKQS
jgi:HPt (histidine-containing phosphotransfer) domain-containing protein